MRKFVLVVSLIWMPLLSFGQYLQIGDGTFGGTAAGPLVVNTTMASYNTRFAYIFPKTVLGNLKHGDTINYLSFGRLAGSDFNTNCNLTIFLKNTNNSDFGSGKLYWPGEKTGTTRVYDQNPKAEIGVADGFHKIPFYNKLFYFDTTLGSNLEMLVEYTQTATQTAVINWYYENGSSLIGYSANQCKWAAGSAAVDSLPNSTDRHPTLILSFPRFDNDIMLTKAYTLGKIPVPLGNPDSVQALVRNVGKKKQTTVRLRTWMKGPNKNQLDSTTFTLNVDEQKYIQVPSLLPAKKGIDTVFVAITGDKNKTNDTGFSYRQANENIYSYRDVSLPPDPGGIGFNGSTGDFVARFYSNKSKNINQVTVNFAFAGRPFKVGIWQAKKNNQPGKLLYLSDSLTTIAGNYILDLKKPVVVSGSFFTGVRQLGTNNVAFGYQTEFPVRPNTFYYSSPAADTNWLDFYPDAPYKFLIEPRTQGDTDLTVLSITAPKDSIDMYVTDSLFPKATIGNIGVTHLKDSFEVVCEIYQYGKLLFKSSLRDTMSAGIKRNYTFPKAFHPKNFGEHSVLIYTKQKNDQIKDNDSLQLKFFVGVKKDVIVSSVYEPSNNTVYEYLKDTFTPVAAILNIGFDATPNFVARCVIKKGKTIIYNKTQTLQLPKFQSKILNWPTYKCVDTGMLDVYFITEMTTDKKRSNDTAKRVVFVAKAFDVGIDSGKIPDIKTFYLQNKPIKPTVAVYNDGLLNVYGAKLWYRVTSVYTKTIWTDTLYLNFAGKEHYSVAFIKSFTPQKKGTYTIVYHIEYPPEFVHSNDSIKYNFNVGYPYDYTGIAVLKPLATDTLDVGAAPITPLLRIKNNGFIKNGDIVPVIYNIWWNNLKVYQDIKSLKLDTGQTYDQVFANSFNPVNAGTYEVIAYTNYSSDVYRKNDTARLKFHVQIGRDAHVISADTPLYTDNYTAKKDNINLQATIANEGKLKMTDVRLYAEIYNKNQLVYYQFINDSLNGYEKKKLTFGNKFNPLDSGIYKILFHTFSQSDQNIFNDTLISFFNVQKGKDVAALEWLNPKNTSILLHTSGAMLPEIRIRNIGTDTNKVFGKVYFSINDSANKNTVYADTALFSNLAMSANDTINGNKLFSVLVPGVYRTKAIVSVLGDNYPENDTLIGIFRIQFNGIRKLNIGDLSIFPNPITGILSIQTSMDIKYIEWVDIAGKVLLTQKGNTRSVDVTSFSSGPYLVRIFTDAGIYSSPVIKN